MKKRVSLLVVFVLIVTLLSGCGSNDSEIPAPDTANTENNDGEKSAVNDNKNDYSSLFSDTAGEVQAKVSDTKDSTSTPAPTNKVETTSVSDTRETDLLTAAKKNKIWAFDTWGTVDDIDYFGAEEIEKALNSGKSLEDKTVMVMAEDSFSDSSGGYVSVGKNIYFLTSNTGVSKVKAGDIMVLTVQSVESYDWDDTETWILYTDIFSKPSNNDNSSKNDYDDID